MSVPPTYAAPKFGGNGDVKTAILDFNSQLKANVIRFQSEHPDAVVLWYDAYTTFGRVSMLSLSVIVGKVTDSHPPYG